jgi:hypothetical protein
MTLRADPVRSAAASYARSPCRRSDLRGPLRPFGTGRMLRCSFTKPATRASRSNLMLSNIGDADRTAFWARRAKADRNAPIPPACSTTPQRLPASSTASQASNARGKTTCVSKTSAVMPFLDPADQDATASNRPSERKTPEQQKGRQRKQGEREDALVDAPPEVPAGYAPNENEGK